MKCYLINLERSADRLKRVSAEFNRHGLSFTRIEAVDGKNLSQEELELVKSPVQLRDLPVLPSEIGCFLSHRKCLENIANGADEYAAVFEDDIILSNQTRKILFDTEWIPTDADIIKIDTFRSVVLLDQCQSIDNTDRQYGRLLSQHLCTGGYIISRSAAKRALGFMGQISVPIDCLLFDPDFELFSQFNIYQIFPALCKQAGFESLIGADRKALSLQYNARPSVTGRIVREIARFYNRSAHILSPSKLWTRLTSTRRWVRVHFAH